ncbi:MAG: hypothetical protein IT557_13275 [Alphaproteobacteria bacterium]|nr:hypothetical protein [Alphaproteobacteria bacterium]
MHKNAPPVSINQNDGAIAAYTWIAAGLFLYGFTAGVSFLSVTAPLFILVGMFAAALLFGGAFRFLRKRLAAGGGAAKPVGMALTAFLVVAVAGSAYLLFRAIEAPRIAARAELSPAAGASVAGAVPASRHAAERPSL